MYLRLTCIILCLGLLHACTTSPTGRSQLALMPESQLNEMGAQAFVSPGDLELFFMTDSIDEAVDALIASCDVLVGSERIIAEMEIEQAIADTGHSIPAKKQARVEKTMHKRIRQAFYDCYREANKNRTFEGANLAEQAPSHPIGVASVIHDYWKNDFWPERKLEIANQLIERYSLPTTETEELIAP